MIMMRIDKLFCTGGKFTSSVIWYYDYDHGQDDNDEDWQTFLHRCLARSLGRRIWQTQDPDPGTDFHYDADEDGYHDDGEDDGYHDDGDDNGDDDAYKTQEYDSDLKDMFTTRKKLRQI